MAFGTQQLDYYLTLEEIKQLGSNFHKKQEYIDNDELIRRFGPNKVRDAAGDRMFASLSQVNYSGGYYADHEERPTESKKNPADSTPEDEKFETDFIKKPFEVLDDIHSILKTNLQILEGQPEDHHRDQDFLEDVFFKHIKIPRKEKYQQLLKGILHKPHLRDLIDHTLKQIESFMMPPATEPENLDVFWIVYLDYLISLDIWDLNIYQTAGEKVSAKNNKEENPESIILRKRAGFLNFCAHYRRDKLEDNYSFKLFILQHFEIGRIIDPDTWFKFLDISPVLIEEAIKKFIERFLQEKDIHYKVFQKKLHELFKTLPDYNIKQLFSDIETPSEIKSKNQVGVVAGNIDHASRLSAGIQESKTENNRHSGCHLERCSTGMTDIYKNPNQDAKRPVELKSATMHPAPPIKEKKVELTWPEVKATLDPVERELGQIFAELKELWKRRNYVKSFITPQSRSFIKEEYQLSSQSIRYAILKKLCRNGDFMIECWETKLRSISQSDKNALSTTISYLDDFLAGFNKFFDTDLDKFMEVILPELENLHNQYLFNPSLTMDDLRKIFFERVFYTIREQDLLTLKTQFR
ncbi:MAG TPA: hypothetical protein VHM20_06255, partial [Gammaproteobacteria bacterium]|nr:hypothetical protein [Gammaproteobacteria bacterium]